MASNKKYRERTHKVKEARALIFFNCAEEMHRELKFQIDTSGVNHLIGLYRNILSDPTLTNRIRKEVYEKFNRTANQGGTTFGDDPFSNDLSGKKKKCTCCGYDIPVEWVNEQGKCSNCASVIESIFERKLNGHKVLA